MTRNITAILIMLVLLAGCGGGGGGGGTVATTGTLQGYVDQDTVARAAGRGAGLSGISGATVTAVVNGTNYTDTADSNGYFQIAGVPAGSYIPVTATGGGITLKAYVNVTGGATTTKNLSARSTAAAMIYDKMVANSLTASAPASPDIMDSSSLTPPVETEIETALSAGTFDYNTVLAGGNVSAAIARIQSGASFSDKTAPAVSLASPGAGVQISDVDFRSETFNLQMGYSDATPAYTSSLSVALSMDGGANQDITGYFSLADAATISSSDLYQFTRTLFDLPSNDTTRTMTLRMSVDDASGNKTIASWSFTVYPLAPPST